MQQLVLRSYLYAFDPSFTHGRVYKPIQKPKRISPFATLTLSFALFYFFLHTYVWRLFFIELLSPKWGWVWLYIHAASCPLGRHDHKEESRHYLLGNFIRCRPTWRGLVTRSWRNTSHGQVWLYTMCNMTSLHDNDSFILLWLDDKIPKGSQMGALT